MKHILKLMHFVKPYWKLAVLSLILLTLMAALDLSVPRLIQRVVDDGIAKNDMATVLTTSLIMIGLSLLSVLAAIGNNIFSIRAGESVARDVREALFVKIQSFSYGNLDRFSTGNLMVRLTSDVSAFQRFVQISLRIGTRAPLMMIGSFILMINTNRQLAFTMIPLLLVTTVAVLIFSFRMEPLFRVTQVKLDRLNTVLQENIAGSRLVKAFVRADYENTRFEAANEDFTERSSRVMKIMSIMNPVLTVFVNLGLVIIVWAGGIQAIEGNLSLGQIFAFTNYMLSTMNPLVLMTMLSNTWANGFASAQRMNEVFDEVPEVAERADAVHLTDALASPVAFDRVDFHYKQQGSSGKVLEDVSFSAKPGETMAILGATGAGKSSLIHLIPRFYDVADGAVMIDGRDVRQLSMDSILAKIAIVPQETILFSGSVLENIRYGSPEASKAEVIAAAKVAQAHDFIERMQHGYDTHIEERGVNLSGGQKQRISIARALVTHPGILILDDSTSSVDVETETRLQKALAEEMHGMTSFIVAQRISTVLNADKILVIERGRIVAQGTHVELMKTSAIYQEIYESQLGNGLQLDLADVGKAVSA